MKNSNAQAALLLIALGLGVWSCASSHAPRGWLDEPRRAPFSGYGGWAEISIRGGPSERIEGEFIAVAHDSVYVLSDEGFHAISKTAIRKARIAVYRSQMGRAASMTGGGVVASLSHGLGFIFSGPIWILVGTMTASGVAHEPLHDVEGRKSGEAAKWDEPSSWDDVAIYARFPQGLPPDLDRGSLRTKVNRAAGTITVRLRDGRVLLARQVEYSESMRILTVHLQTGETERVGALHVRSIVAEDGKNITKEIMRL